MTTDVPGWDAVQRRQDGLVTRQQVLACGWSVAALRHKLESGRWTRVLPRVLLTGTGDMTDRQRLRAALLYAGRNAALTGPTACRLHGLRVTHAEQVHVAVPAAAAATSIAFVRVRPTTRTPHTLGLDGMRTVAAERAVVDAAMEMFALNDVRALVADAVQRRLVSLARLTDELAAGPVRGSRHLRKAIAEVSVGARSAPEAELLSALKRRRDLPPYELNVDVRDALGRWLARPDVVFREQRLIVEVDSMRWHLSPDRWAADLERHTRLEAAGWTVLRYPASRVFAEADVVVHEIATCLADRRRAA